MKEKNKNRSKINALMQLKTHLHTHKNEKISFLLFFVYNFFS